MNEIKIPQKKLKGDDGYKVFSIRIPVELYNELNDFVKQTSLSRNELITILLRGALDIAVIDEN